MEPQDVVADVTAQDPEPLQEAACSSHLDEINTDLDGCLPQDDVAMITTKSPMCLQTPTPGEEMRLAPPPMSARVKIHHFPLVVDLPALRCLFSSLV